MKNKIGFLLSLLVFLALVASACGPSPAPTSGGGAPAAPTAGTLTLVGADPPTLDPSLAQDATSAEYIVEIFSGLVGLNTRMEVVPDLAERWDVSEDGKTYTFFLRKGAKFHDGKEIKASDFQYALERATDPNTGSTVADTYLGDIIGAREKLRGQRKQLPGVKVVDDFTLQITIDAPKTYFLAKLTYPTGFVLDQANVESGRNWTDKPNGSGPFKLKEWRKAERIVLSRNENYYRGVPKVEEVRFLLAGGSSMTMYENNEIDTTVVGLTDIERVLDKSSPLSKELKTATRLGIFYVGFNYTKPPFDDVNVRKAFNYATDKERLVSIVLKNIGRAVNGIIPPGMPGYNENVKGYPLDPAKAKEALAQSKYKTPSGLPPIVFSAVGAGGTPSPIATALQEMWKQNLGVEVEIQQVEFATYLGDVRGRKYQMFGGTAGWIADYPDPEDFHDVLFHSKSLDNNFAYGNPQVDAALEKARVEKDVDARIKMYHQIEEMILADAPLIPLYSEVEYRLIKPYVKGLEVPPAVVPVLKDVSIER
ncbi:MAG TPA: peptide ABC transporter substrate-binding protein [Dehalococcoidia bacterium]|nr:peptide ABC transporter substrate-binding protein [Dehalococcoidia bacterium]